MNDRVQVTLPVAGLAAAFRLAARNDIRYYLNAVKVEVTPDHVTFVGTDGQTLAAARCESEDNGDTAEFIISRDDVAAILKNIGAEKSLRATLVGESAIEFEFGTHHIKTTRVSGKYPEWRAVATPENGQRGRNTSIHAKFFGLVQKSVAAAIKYGEPSFPNIFMETNGHDRALTLLFRGSGIEVAYVVMPARDTWEEGYNHTDAGLLAGVAERPEAA